MTSETPVARSTPRPSVLAASLYSVFFIVFAAAALAAPESDALAPIFLSVLIGATIAIFCTWSFSEQKTDDRSLRNLIFIGMVMDLGFNFAASKVHGSTSLEAIASGLKGLGNVGILATTIGVGLFVGRGLKTPNYLVVAAIAGALTDIYSVFMGPSKHVSNSIVFDYLSFQWGVIGHRGIDPIVGAGDFIFLTLYFYGSRKFGIDDRRTLWAMIFAVATGFVATLFLGAVPALPFMSAALLLTHGRELKAQMRSNR